MMSKHANRRSRPGWPRWGSERRGDAWPRGRRRARTRMGVVPQDLGLDLGDEALGRPGVRRRCVESRPLVCRLLLRERVRVRLEGVLGHGVRARECGWQGARGAGQGHDAPVAGGDEVDEGVGHAVGAEDVDVECGFRVVERGGGQWPDVGDARAHGRPGVGRCEGWRSGRGRSPKIAVRPRDASIDSTSIVPTTHPSNEHWDVVTLASQAEAGRARAESLPDPVRCMGPAPARPQATVSAPTRLTPAAGERYDPAPIDHPSARAAPRARAGYGVPA